ncbi:hypothetical protein CTI12_AA609430 [Artemisia annua]|uniref:Uncharacterized protein n=1 Tax=Artemisia annua TaxID=35608 RepID=A0A2U1KFR6_ARTAN|nr:hypothetical protein CTI12_AA609430 [Artemisia annua]
MLNKKPPLDVIRTWSDIHYASPEAGRIVEDWLYILNEGSEMDIFYSVPSSSSLLLTITREDEYPTWFYHFDHQPHLHIIHGNGVIHQKILQSGRYRIGVINFDSRVEVQLNITARALIYNTSEARDMCMVAQGQCSLPVLFGAENYAVLTTHLKQGISDGESYVNLSYQPRLSAYFGGIVLVIIIMYAAICLFNTSIRIICGLVDRWRLRFICHLIVFMISVLFAPICMGPYRVGAGSSSLIQVAIPYFVESIDAFKFPDKKVEPILYMLNKKPPLDVIRTWSDIHYASPEAGRIVEDWLYILNEGSEMDIFYSVPSSSSLLLTITREDEYPTWFYRFDHQPHLHIIHGNGVIHQKILQSGRYRIGVINFDSRVEVQLNITARALIYNTSEARDMCMVAQGQCSLPVLFGAENYAVLTTHLKQGISDGESYVNLSYQPRLSAYFGGIVLVIIIMYAAICLFNTSIRIICGLVDRWRFVFKRSLLP